MAKPKVQHYWQVPIPWEVFMELSDYMSEIRSKDSMGDLAGRAIRIWIENERLKQNGSQPDQASLLSGYQWKRLFLPDGTMARTLFRGSPRIAQVANSHLVFEGTPTSPHEFANANVGSPRNAWKAIWLLFPGEREWKLADDCRPARASRTASQEPRPT